MALASLPVVLIAAVVYYFSCIFLFAPVCRLSSCMQEDVHIMKEGSSCWCKSYGASCRKTLWRRIVFFSTKGKQGTPGGKPGKGEDVLQIEREDSDEDKTKRAQPGALDDGELDICVICLERLDPEAGNMTILKYDHAIHSNCHMELKNAAIKDCPICKSSL